MGATTKYNLDSSGNLTAFTDTNGGTTTYAYDVLGRLVGETGATGSTPGQGMAVSSHTAQPDSVTLHVYGNGLVSEKRSGEYLYHHYNNLGSTMRLTDGAGSIARMAAAGTRLPIIQSYQI